MYAQLKRLCLHEEVKQIAENSMEKSESTGRTDRRSIINTSTIRNVLNASFAENRTVSDGVKT
jgi:hypothetical protein